jgi:glycosyltransferase involved in cell wall biosynthesis
MISIVILAFNEAHRLEPCLQSAIWADEIIVVDGFSTDSTVELAKRYTDKVFQSDLLGPANPGGFGAQRNFGLVQAVHDWVLFLDADERVTPELAQEIRSTLPRCQSETAVFQIGRREHYFGVYSPYTHGRAYQPRLIRRSRAKWDERRVHEGILTDGKIDSLQEYLLHFSKDSIADYVSTMNRYTTLEAEESFGNGIPLARGPFGGMAKTFLYFYVHEQSYREGAFGLVMSLLRSTYVFLCWAKQWELEMKAGRRRSDEPLCRWPRLTSALHRLWHLRSPSQKEK